MQRDKKIDPAVGQLVPGYVGNFKAQPGIAVLGRDGVAALDNVGFEVIADHVHVKAALDGKIVIEDKGQIGFAAAKVHHRQRSRLDRGKGIVDQLDKTVDLAVFVIFGLDDAQVRREDAKVHQRGNVFPLGEKIAFFAVVRERGCSAGAGDGGSPALLIRSVTPQDILSRAVPADKQDLAIAAVERLGGKAEEGGEAHDDLSVSLFVEAFLTAGALDDLIAAERTDHRVGLVVGEGSKT